MTTGADVADDLEAFPVYASPPKASTIFISNTHARASPLCHSRQTKLA